jgi:hypothetical protein
MHSHRGRWERDKIALIIREDLPVNAALGFKKLMLNNTFAIKQLFSLRESFLAQESSQEVAQ